MQQLNMNWAQDYDVISIRIFKICDTLLLNLFKYYFVAPLDPAFI